MRSERAGKPVKILIVGGGFGGRYTALHLRHRLPSGSAVTLIDQNNYLLYTPMLTEAAGRSVSPQHIQAPNSTLSPDVNLVQAKVTSVDVLKKAVSLYDGRVLYGDHVVLALGSTTNFHNVPGAEEHCLTMKTLEDARRVEALTQRNVQRAAMETDPARRKVLLSFVVAGGGYTGVETIAAINDLVHDTAKSYGVPREDISLTLVEPAHRIMAEMPETLASYTLKRLKKDGITVLMGVAVQQVHCDGVELSNGTTLSAGLIIWDAGIRASAVVSAIDCPKSKTGHITTESTFRVKGHPGIWAIGDCAEIPKADGSGTYFEATAQNATRQGAVVADNIVATMEGRPLKAFRYKQIGELAVISRYGGVANVYGLRIRGVLAWLMWRGIYVVKMPNMRARVGIVADWIRLLFSRFMVPVTWRLPKQVQNKP